jgi:glutamate carboxypeptidase
MKTLSSNNTAHSFLARVPQIISAFASPFVIAISIAIIPFEGVQAAGLTAEEQGMVEWIDAHAAEATVLLEELVNINSGTMNPEGVYAVGGILEARLQALGLETEWVKLPDSMGRAGHLVARQNGSQGKKILMIGHLDTVFEPGDSFQQARREGDWLHGPGVEDMKGGDVVMLYALMALKHAGVLEDSRLVLFFTGDEESPGEPLEVTRHELVELGKRADVALGFEAGIRDDSFEWATVARRSASEWMLEVNGVQAHSSGIFTQETGAGAIFEAARILSDFYDEVRGEEYLTFNAGSILGGTEINYDAETTRGTTFGKTNVVPNSVVVHGGIRTISPDQLHRAQAAMESVVARHLPHTDATISFIEGYPPMAPTDGNIRLQSMLSDINIELGRQEMPALDPSRRGAADISFVAPYVDSLAGLGPHGDGGHSPDERIDLTSLPQAIQRAAILVYRLTRQ